ncbi:MAG: His-Xaa-Ser system protein HxsD [Desulfobaccales bacterium]
MSRTVNRQDNKLVFQISKAIYEKEAVLAALYALSGHCRNRMEPVPEGYVTVTLEPLEALGDVDLEKLEHRFLTELTDQQFRLELERRYGDLRRLIIQHAFSPLADLRREVKKAVGRD